MKCKECKAYEFCGKQTDLQYCEDIIKAYNEKYHDNVPFIPFGEEIKNEQI